VIGSWTLPNRFENAEGLEQNAGFHHAITYSSYQIRYVININRDTALSFFNKW